jgi:N-acetylglucosamine malate deacetylase 1
MAQRVLVIAAHPDDEVLGAGGAMAWHRSRGDRVMALVLGEGISARSTTRAAALTGPHRRRFATLKAEMARAHRALGVQKTFQHDFADNRFDSVELLDIVKVIERVMEEVDPHIVYTHHGGDLNNDHRLTFEAVLAACRPLPGRRLERLLSFEVLSSTEWAPPTADRAFLPNVFIDIERVLARKLKAMAAYRGELKEFPHPRSLDAIRHQAHLWGAKAGVNAAEAFVLIRERLTSR